MNEAQRKRLSDAAKARWAAGVYSKETAQKGAATRRKRARNRVYYQMKKQAAATKGIGEQLSATLQPALAQAQRSEPKSRRSKPVQQEFDALYLGKLVVGVALALRDWDDDGKD